MTLKPVGTPCIGVCSTTFGDTVCRGCKRFLHEVVDWNRYQDNEKRTVWRRLDQLLCLVVDNYLEVSDAALLRQQMTYQNLRLQPEFSPPGWVPELLKAAGSRRLDWNAFGLQARRQAQGLSARELYDLISAEFHALSCAHHERAHLRVTNEAS
ncbi:MAG: DUF1289 domain-containing protein [Alcanivoracaceae bacterium]|nr:DUF1289 domain-containing protein [Alcanivoracaceae bacterium]